MRRLTIRSQPHTEGTTLRTPRRRAGQSLAEFAIVLPILLVLLGTALDYARVHEVRVTLEASTRDAAEHTAMLATTQAEAATQARRVVCLQFGKPEDCSDPTVTVSSYTRSTTAAGASNAQPLVSVTVQSELLFETLFPYPFLTDRGKATLSASSTYHVLQGR